MTREEKVAKLKEKIIVQLNEAIKGDRSLLLTLLTIDEEYEKNGQQTMSNNVNLQICFTCIHQMMLYWVKSDLFCMDYYSADKFIIKDRDLDIMLQDSFNFVTEYFRAIGVSHSSKIPIKEIILSMGDTFSDSFIVNEVISVVTAAIFDYYGPDDGGTIE